MSELKEPILNILNKIYESDSMLELKFKRYDLAIKTDQKVRAILLFMGEKDPVTGKIKGERYLRRLLEDHDENVPKDNWDNKGTASAQL